MQTSEHSTTVPLKAIFVSILLVLTAAGAFSAAITVGPTGPPTFDYASIQAAITAASNGDAVQVAAGTYNELVMWDNKDLQLIGAGADVTTINGNSTVPVVFIHDVPATASFSGFTVTGGTTRGGVWLQRSSLTFSDNVITGNHTQADGGGMRIDWGSPTILRNHIYGNSADEPGGGIYMSMCTSPLLVENVIQSNVAPHGGGIFVTGTTNLQITDGVIEHNDALAPARGYGAGMYLANTGAAVEGVTFNYNRAIHGGAIYFADGSLASSLSVGDCLFQGNSASGYGGAIAAAAGASCTIDDSIFASNQAGSGILVMGTPGHVMGCLLHRNTCDPFAPQVLTAAAVTIDRCTLAAPAGCSAMVEATSGALTITNSIVESGYFVGVAVVGTPLNISNSNVYGQGLLYRGILNQTGLNGNISVDPKFASPETADFHLRSAIGRYTPGGWVTDPPQQHSPCIDKADPVADHSNESDWPAGRLNMGAYGNTAEASKGGNVQPYGLVVEVMPASPETTQPLVCSIVTPAVDPNVDPVTYRYEWYEDGVHRPAYDGMTTLPADATEPGNMWKCVVTPTDGLLDGTPAQAEVHISGLIQVPAEYATIQGGIDAAWDGDEVQVASGTYNEDITWAGKDIRVSTRNGGTINGSGQTSVVTISDVPASAKFSNFVVKGGSANNGGGLHVTDSSLEMSLITVSENAAQSRGGGVYIEGGAPTFTNGVVAHSQSGGDGGGIYVINSDASIIGNHLMFNNATGDGGGICIDGGTTKVSQCYIASNTAGRDGGAIVHKSGTSDIYRCKFQYNTSTRNGGAVCIYAPLTRMSENSFVENTLGGGTGVAVGGGVFIDRQAAWPIFPISNNLFAGNRGSDGPAICINDTQGSNWELTNCTMADNVGGAFRIETGSATISNSIVWANTDGTPLQGNIDVDYCCIGPDAVNVGGTDNFNADPLFVDGGVDGYHLKSVFGRWNHWSQSWIVDDEHSPCIDNGDPASDFSRESDPNGGRVNLGAWGNTETASRGGNVPPTQPVVDIQPDAPLTTDDLLLTVVTESTDPNLDPVTLTRRWFLDGVHQADLDDATTVPAGRTVKGQVWRYEMTPNDGQVDGPTGFDELTIGNTVPGPVVAEITPTAPLTTDDLQVSVTGGDDPDDDTITHRYRWSRDGQPQADLDDATTVPAAQTANGETWRCEVTPNDGEADGPTAFDEVTIGNTAPGPLVVEIAPIAPLTTDDLQVSVTGGDDPDDQPITHRYRWSRDGQPQADLDDATTVPAAQTANGETWRCEVTPNDGEADGPMAFDEVTIGNTAPGPLVVQIEPATPLTTDDLQVSVTGGDDPDDQPITHRYRWSRDGQPQADLDDATTVPAAQTANGETWRCEVTPTDGTSDGPSAFDEVTIGNTAPGPLVVEIAPIAPLTTDDLLVSVSGGDDPDGDTITHRYRWSRDGAPQADLDDATTVPAARTANGETWRCEVTPNDGEADGPSAFDEVTIGNTAPGPLVVEITPTAPLTTDDLLVSVTGDDDPDGQPITHRYRWSRDGQSQADLDDATTVPADRTANGETWRCEVTPNDGEADGPSAFDEVTIGNTAPLITGVSISPDPAATTDDLQATPSGWFDADGDQEGYLWSWERRSGDQWLPIAGATTATLTSDLFAAGDELRVICIPDDGTAPGEAARAEIVIANTPPGAPSECTVAPAEPTSADDLTVAASGAEDADGEELAWEHQWRRSTDGGSTWDTWGRDGSTLASSLTSVGETWQARSRASDGASEGPWLESNMVGICDRVAHSFGAGVQLVGLPLQPLDPAPGAVFPGCEVAGDWTGSAYSQPDSIDCGRGYWSNFPTPMDVSLRGRLAEGDSMTVGLAGTGWHMLGNPFTDALSWPNVVGDGLLPYGWIWEADLQSYRLVANLNGLNITGEIPPWSGFWVKLASAATDVTMSRGAAPASQSQPMSLEPVAPEDWVLRLTARAGDCADVDNFIGVLSQGALRIEEPPTSAGDSVALYCAAAGGGRDAVSIVASATATLSWDLVVQTSLANVPVVVQYPDLSTVPGEWKLYLVDLETGARRYMRTTERYEFMAGESGANRHLRLEAVQEADGPAMITSLAARPSSSGVEVCYTLTGAASVDAEVLNISGRTVRVLGRDRVSPAGETRLSWNLVSDAGTAVPNGTYLCRITARTETGMRTDRIVTLQIAR